MNWPKLKYHNQQQALLRSKARIVAVAAGRGSGKTEIAKRKLILSLADKKPWPDPKYFFAAPTEGQAKRIAWDDFIKLIPKNWIDSVNLSELKIKTVFGSELMVVGLDKPQRIEGNQYDGCVIDESSDIKPKTYELSIAPALTHRDGWCWRIGIPKRKGIGAKEFKSLCERITAGEIDGEHYSWTTAEILDPEYLNKIRTTLDAYDFQEQFEARWVSNSGLIFHAFNRDLNVRACNYDLTKEVLVGCDFNVNPMSWVLAHKYDNRIEVFDEIWLRDTNTPKTLDTLVAKYSEHKNCFTFFPDASGNSRKTSASLSDFAFILNESRIKTKINAPKKNPSIADRFSATNALLCNANNQHNLHIDPRCRRLIEDLEARYYKDGTNEPADSGDLGHITDALGYMVHRLFPIRVENTGTGAVIIGSGRR